MKGTDDSKNFSRCSAKRTIFAHGAKTEWLFLEDSVYAGEERETS
jgi:hypothetical protein